jgi:hypothetical protein
MILDERHLSENDSLKVKVISLENELAGIDVIIKSIEKDGITKHSKVGELKLKKGKHLLQISGLFKGTQQGERLEFVITQDQNKETKLLEIVPYFGSGSYTYPYSLSEPIELDKETNITVSTGSIVKLINHLVTTKSIVN